MEWYIVQKSNLGRHRAFRDLLFAASDHEKFNRGGKRNNMPLILMNVGMGPDFCTVELLRNLVSLGGGGGVIVTIIIVFFSLPWQDIGPNGN